jgi:transcriptional regulator with XRE-family HTH domain
MEVNDRIKLLIEEKAKSERDFALRIGINQATLNYYTSGKRKLSLETIYAILGTFQDVSAEWLLRGEGEMLKGDVASGQSSSSGKLSGDESSFYKKIIDEQLDTIGMLKKKVSELEEQNVAGKDGSKTA